MCTRMCMDISTSTSTLHIPLFAPTRRRVRIHTDRRTYPVCIRVYVCIYANPYTCTNTRTCTCTRTHTCVHIYMYVYIYICVRVYIHMHIHMHARRCARASARTPIYTYTLLGLCQLSLPTTTLMPNLCLLLDLYLHRCLYLQPYPHTCMHVQSSSNIYIHT